MFPKIRQFVKRQFTVCPKTGKITGLNLEKEKAFWLYILLGIASVLWVLIRVLPKPSRASYPCQKVALPLAASTIIWLIGLTGTSLFLHKARRLFKKQRYLLGLISFVVAVVLVTFTRNDIRLIAASSENAAFVPTDPANTPVGNAQGIQPGRVVWVYDDQLCDQGGTSGWWWEDQRTDPEVARLMMASAITNLTGIENQAEAWDSLFRYFNLTHYDQVHKGYQKGDKIAIKVNNIFSRSYEWRNSQDNRPCPQMVHALIWQLVNMAGVPEEDITFYDCIFYHGDPVYQYCHADFPGVRWAEGDATDRSGYESGPGSNPGTREKVLRDPECVVHFGDTDLIQGSGEVCLPTVVSEAKYMMSIGLPRAHELAGVTICAKNFFGSVWHPTIYDYYHQWQPMFMHEAIAARDFSASIPMRPMGTYNSLVDLMGHKDLGGKTILCLVECIRYRYWSAPPFNGGPASSLFMSQDFVAIESVLLDFLRSEGGVPAGTADNYLHEAAQAGNPPSGTTYDPENDGIPLESLGTHEHWNNSTDKQYSRNLGTGEGIELVQVMGTASTGIEPYINGMAEGFVLSDNFPNPFRVSTTIRYTLPVDCYIRFNIYSMNGQKVCTAVDQYQLAGTYEFNWTGCDDSKAPVSPGSYICRMEVNTGTELFGQSRHMLLLE